MVKNIKNLVYGLMIASLLGVVAFSFQQSQQKASASQNGRAEFISKVSQGLTEAHIETLRTSPSFTVESLSNVIQQRAKVSINPVVKSRLIDLENRTIGKTNQLVSFDKVVEVLATTMLERASKLTDAEIKQLIATQRGFSSPDLPSDIKNDIAIFPGNYIDVSDEEAFNYVKAASNAKSQILIKPVVEAYVSEQLKMHLANYAAAAPETFGENWNNSTASPGKGLTPSQVMLLSYTLVSGDSFMDSASLATAMERKESGLVSIYGHYPSSAGQSPYGANGYLHSSATNLFFDETVQTLILNKLSEGN